MKRVKIVPIAPEESDLVDYLRWYSYWTHQDSLIFIMKSLMLSEFSASNSKDPLSTENEIHSKIYAAKKWKTFLRPINLDLMSGYLHGPSNWALQTFWLSHFYERISHFWVSFPETGIFSEKNEHFEHGFLNFSENFT